jgi:hypothetical protein
MTDGAVPLLRCRSKVAQKVALRLWNALTSPNPSRQRNPSESGLQALRCVRGKKGVHVISNAIAKFMADHPHSIQPGHKLIPALVG